MNILADMMPSSKSGPSKGSTNNSELPFHTKDFDTTKILLDPYEAKYHTYGLKEKYTEEEIRDFLLSKVSASVRNIFWMKKTHLCPVIYIKISIYIFFQVQAPYLSKNHKNKIRVIPWDHRKTYALAIFAGCFLVWAAIFFPVLFYSENM